MLVVAHTFFGKVENIGPVSREELFFMFSIFQYLPINYDAFLLAGLDRVSHQTIENIYVGGTVTDIALALGLQPSISLDPIVWIQLARYRPLSK